MAYTDDSVKAKLSSLNETQEAIVTVAQWIMFHRRHADRTAQLWMARLKESNAGRKLNLIYLANEVVQQSKSRSKDEFVKAFSPVMADAMATACRGVPGDVQTKLRRVIEVWRERRIFDPKIQEDIEARAAEFDRTRSSGRKQLGGSLFATNANAAPAELQPLVPLQIASTKAEVAATSAKTTAQTEYEKLTGPNAPELSLPVHAARLAAVLKNLSTAEGAVAASIKAQKSLIESLEALLKTNLDAVTKKEQEQADLAAKKAEFEIKRREVEDSIMRGLAEGEEPSRPQVERLTPPPVESLTPTGTPPPMPAATTTTEADTIQEQTPALSEAPTDPRLASGVVSSSVLEIAQAAVPLRTRGAEEMNGNGQAPESTGPALKKRKKSGGDDDYATFLGDDDGLDADVQAMLGND